MTHHENRAHRPPTLDGARLEMAADVAVAPASRLDPGVRAAHKEQMLLAARASFLPPGAGSQDGYEVTTQVVEVNDHPMFPAGLLIADVEPLDALRIEETANRVVDAVAAHCFNR